MKRGTVILIVALAIAGLAAALTASILHDGLRGRARTADLEAMMARNARHLSIPANAREARNPVAASAENLREARLHFANHCATCHANDGGGDTLIGQGLYPKPLDVRLPETQKLSDGELFWIVENGVRFTGMPAFAGHGAEEDSWKLVLFIRHLPQLTAEERMEMERYNPKGPDDRADGQREVEFLNVSAPEPNSDPAHHPP